MKIEDRISVELQIVKKGGNLLDFAKVLKKEGISKDEMLLVFDTLREQHESDEDQTQYDAILDTMDFISGNCISKYLLFDLGTN